MSRKTEPGFQDRFSWFIDRYALPWLKLHVGGRARSLRALAHHAKLNHSTLYGWTARAHTPDRAELVRFLEAVRLREPGRWAIWILTGATEKPSTPESLDGWRPASPDDRSDPRTAKIMSAQVAQPLATNRRSILDAVKRGVITVEEAELALDVLERASLPGLDSNQE